VWLTWVSSRLPTSSSSSLEEMIKSLVNKARTMETEDLLVYGSMKGILFYVMEALRRGVDRISKNDALIIAAEGGHDDIVVYLIEHGADVNVLDLVGANLSEEEEALIEAAANGNFDGVRG